MRSTRLLVFTAAGLAVLVACSTGNIEDGEVRDGDRPDAQGDAGAPLDDADPGDADDAGPDVSLAAERPLVCGDAGFCETRLPLLPRGEVPVLTSVWAVAANDVWSVSNEGAILHYDGTSWRIDHQISRGLLAVWATHTSVWAAGDAGIILRRNDKGVWSTIESGHLSTIRTIAGTSDTDVWFTSHDGSVDHFDGAALTNHPLNVPGLQTTTVFGRAGVGMYAAGYVLGPFPQVGAALDKSYLFGLSAAGVTTTKLISSEGWVVASGVVTDAPEEGQRIFVAGYQRTRNGLSPGAMTMAGVPFSGNFGPLRPYLTGVLPALPLWARAWDDVYIPVSFSTMPHYDGVQIDKSSLIMGTDFFPRFISGAHGVDAEMWIVGTGFALKGPTR